MTDTANNVVEAAKIESVLAPICRSAVKWSKTALESAAKQAQKIIDALNKAEVDPLSPKALKRTLRDTCTVVLKESGEKYPESKTPEYYSLDNRLRAICRQYAKLTDQQTTDSGSGNAEKTALEKAQKAADNLESKGDALKLAAHVAAKLSITQAQQLIVLLEKAIIAAGCIGDDTDES